MGVLFLLFGFWWFQQASLASIILPAPRNDFRGLGTHWATLSGKPSKLMGHRGEKVLMPENTLGSYEIASIENPDYVEPDLAMTKDRHFVCYHDLTLKGGSNVASIPELAHLKGRTVPGDWYIPDLTLAQIKMLKVEQKQIGIRPLYFNDLFEIPTFEEFLDLILDMSYKMNQSIGIVPELKHPEVVNERVGIPNYMENKALQVLQKYGYPIRRKWDVEKCETRDGHRVPCGSVIIQCFHKDTLKYLSQRTDIALMMLIENDPHLLTRNALDELSTFVKYYAVWKGTLVSGVAATLKYNNIEYNSTQIEQEGGFIPTGEFPKLVHEKGMELGIYTIYDSREPSLHGCEIECESVNKKEELFHYFRIGVDALFVENIKEARELEIQFDYDMHIGASSDSRRSFQSSISSVVLGLVFSFLFQLSCSVSVH